MKIDPNLLSHPKFIRLKRQIGDLALEYLVRLWGHCEHGRRGEWWVGADADYIETVANYQGGSGQLAKVLEDTRWIHTECGGIRIHDWNETNWRAVSSWKNGENGGRKPKDSNDYERQKPESKSGLRSRNRNRRPVDESDSKETGIKIRLPTTETGSSVRYQSELSGTELSTKPPTPSGVGCDSVPPADDQGAGFFEVPSEAEVREFAESTSPNLQTGCPSIAVDWAMRHQLRWAKNTTKTPRDWRKWLKIWWANDWLNRPSPSAQESVWNVKQRIQALRERIAEHPFNSTSTAFVGNDFESEFPKEWNDGMAELASLRREHEKFASQVGSL